jgi:PTH1 family peptidyl-tRNA hydrolase
LLGARAKLRYHAGMALKIIAGLGNPDSKYLRTRHNAGWMLIDRLSQAWSIPIDGREKHQSLYGEGDVEGNRVLILKPLTYMNLSGNAIAPWVKYRNADPALDLLVVCDEMQLSPGKMRLRPKGSAGSHNGLAHIIERLGGGGFPRLRIGVGAPSNASEWADHVLKTFPPQEWDQVALALVKAQEACLRFVKGEAVPDIMSRCNG